MTKAKSMDWESCFLPGVQETLSVAVGRVVSMYGEGLVNSDDLNQEGQLALAKNGREVRRCVGNDRYDHLYTMVYHDLLNAIETDVRRANQAVSMTIIEEYGRELEGA